MAFYDTPLQIALTTATPGAEIRYTTDRTEPTATRGMIYSNPISVTGTTVLRAGAFRSGWAPAESVTHTYVLISNVITSSVMRRSITTNAVYGPQRAALPDFPSISLSVTPSTINGTTEVKASLEWLRPDGEPGFQEPCGVRLFGGAFTDFAKKSFRLYFRSEYGASKLKYRLFTGSSGASPPWMSLTNWSCAVARTTCRNAGSISPTPLPTTPCWRRDI